MNGNRQSIAVAAGVGTANVVVSPSAGELTSVLVTATGTAALSIYDNASAASGKVIGYVPANATAGTVYLLYMGAANGITVGQVSNSPAITVSFL